MATLQKAIKVGSSIAAVLPKALLEETGITAGTPIMVEAVDGGVLIRPSRPRRKKSSSVDERVAETALDLMKRYRSALERLADA